MRLYASGTAVARNRIDHASNETLSCNLIGLARCVVNFVEWIAHESTLRWALAQGGQSNGRGLSIQIRDLVFSEGRNLSLWSPVVPVSQNI